MLENLGLAMLLAALLAGVQILAARLAPPLVPVPVRVRDVDPPRR